MTTPKPTREELLRQDIEFLLSPDNLANSKYSVRARNVARALQEMLQPSPAPEPTPQEPYTLTDEDLADMDASAKELGKQ